MTEGPQVDERVRMPLLTLITQQSLDEDYQDAAERRRAGAPRPPEGRQVRTAAVVVLVFGVLVSTAFVQTNRNADVNTASRETLIQRINNASDRRARQETRAATLRDRVAQLERGLTRTTADELTVAGEERRLEIRTGFVPVTGEGVRVVVTQAETADNNQQVQDSDLALLVNGLFEAGAEAVAVDGHRMTARSAIRTSGTAIGVNGFGIESPFVVEAIGDTRTLSARLFDTTTGLQFVRTSQQYGFTYTVDNVQSLRLPAAPDVLQRLVLAGPFTDQFPNQPKDIP